MEMESIRQEEKKGCFGNLWGGIKGILGRLQEKVIEIAKETKKIGKEDPRKIIHSAKVGLALNLMSLFYYLRPLYDGFGQAGMYAVLTVVVVFEFSVGGTLCKSLNRGLATLLAGALGVGAKYLAEVTGKSGEPFLLGLFVFILAAGSTFSRFFANIKKRYDYGVMIFILTFSMVAVSGYRVDDILQMAHQRLSTIVIGGATCMAISIFICPAWAGEDLHNLIANNIEKVAIFLEGFGEEYFNFEDGDWNINANSKAEKSYLQGYKSVLNSKAREDALANAAWWEPCHGRFRFRHPWKQYLKVGVLTRQCASHIEALIACYINSNLNKGAKEFQKIIQEPCKRMSSESGKALKELSMAIKVTSHPSAVETHVRNSKSAVDDVTSVLKSTSLEKADLLEIIPAVAVASTLIDIIKCVDQIADSVQELSSLAHFKTQKSTTSTPDKQRQQLLHRGIVLPVNDSEVEQVVVVETRSTLHDDLLEIENIGVVRKSSGHVEV